MWVKGNMFEMCLWLMACSPSQAAAGVKKDPNRCPTVCMYLLQNVDETEQV
jgi:hypothetical protein